MNLIPYSLAWVKINRSNNCPQHGGEIKPGWYSVINYCPECSKFWKVRRSKYSGKAMWYFITLHESLDKKIEELKEKLNGNKICN